MFLSHSLLVFDAGTECSVLNKRRGFAWIHSGSNKLWNVWVKSFTFLDISWGRWRQNAALYAHTLSLSLSLLCFPFFLRDRWDILLFLLWFLILWISTVCYYDLLSENVVVQLFIFIRKQQQEENNSISYMYICVSGVAPCHHVFTSNKRMHAVMQNLISAICAVFLCLYAFLSHLRVPCTSSSPPTTQLWSCVQERKMLEALTCNWFASTSQLSVAEVVCLHWLLTPYSPSTPSPTPLFVAGGGASWTMCVCVMI